MREALQLDRLVDAPLGVGVDSAIRSRRPVAASMGETDAGAVDRLDGVTEEDEEESDDEDGGEAEDDKGDVCWAEDFLSQGEERVSAKMRECGDLQGCKGCTWLLQKRFFA